MSVALSDTEGVVKTTIVSVKEADPAAFDEQAVLLQAAVLELLGNQWAYPSVKFPDGMMNFGETRDLRTLAEEWAKGKLGKE